MENRKRPERLVIRVDNKEKNIILERMKEANQKDFSSFARKMLMNGLIVTPNWEELKEIHRQLSGMGNNINQIARIANSTHSIYKSDVDELTRQLADTHRMMFDLIELMKKIENGGK